MAKKEETAVNKTTKVRVVFTGGNATIYRDGLPFIIDKVESSVKWLNDKGYKKEVIETVGDKPECWNAIYPEEVVV